MALRGVPTVNGTLRYRHVHYWGQEHSTRSILGTFKSSSPSRSNGIYSSSKIDVSYNIN